jgi:plastocyanin
MKTYLTLFLGWLLATAAVDAGTITGTVRAHGKEGADEDVAGGKYESHKFKFAERVDYSQFRDFVVYIDQTFPEKTTPPVAPLHVVVQKDAAFSPHVLPILVGTTVDWPNHDEIFHNAFSISEAKQFDLGLYKDKVKQVTFDKPGRIDVFCSIHSTMHCIILVLENPYFATTDANGRFTIPNVPAGTYKLKAWHERLPATTKEVIVPEKGEVNIDLTLGITGLPQY